MVLRALRHLEMHGQPDGRDAALEDVAHLLDKPVEQVRKVLGYNERTTSLDAPLDRDGGVSIGDALADEDALRPSSCCTTARSSAGCACGSRSSTSASAR